MWLCFLRNFWKIPCQFLPYSTVVLCIGIMKVRGFWSQIITLNPAWYLLSHSLRAFVRHSQAQKCLRINPIKQLWNFKKIVFNAFFYWLTDLLMPSDKHNSIMATATGSISSHFNIASSGNVPFCQLQQLQCLHHGSTKAYLVLLFAPFLSP